MIRSKREKKGRVRAVEVNAGNLQDIIAQMEREAGEEE